MSGAWRALVLATLFGCTAEVETLRRMGGSADAGAAATPDADSMATEPHRGAATVPCGLNRCWTGEVCCSLPCGICTYPDECVPYDEAECRPVDED